MKYFYLVFIFAFVIPIGYQIAPSWIAGGITGAGLAISYFLGCTNTGD